MVELRWNLLVCSRSNYVRRSYSRYSTHNFGNHRIVNSYDFTAKPCTFSFMNSEKC
jgi:hypothetical protein